MTFLKHVRRCLIPIAIVFCIIECSGHNHTCYVKKQLHSLLKQTGIYLKSTVTKLPLSSISSISSDKTKYYVHKNNQYSLPRSLVSYQPLDLLDRLHIDDFFGLGYIGERDWNIFISDKLHCLIFSLPTIIQLPNGRWVVETLCLPDSERVRIIWRVKHSGFRFCPTVYKMTWAEFIAHDCCNSYCH